MSVRDLVARIRYSFREPTLNSLGYPTRDELTRVGLTGENFYARYILATPAGGSVHDFSRRVLSRFYADYPELDPFPLKRPGESAARSPGTP